VLRQNSLLIEAARQTQMIRKLQQWFCMLLALSGVGIVFVWWGFYQIHFGYVMQAGGGILAFGSLVAALIVQKGIGNGRKNVERILSLAENQEC
jgi:hypothetical protein